VSYKNVQLHGPSKKFQACYIFFFGHSMIQVEQNCSQYQGLLLLLLLLSQMNLKTNLPFKVAKITTYLFFFF
jgi:hypothetical protein